MAFPSYATARDASDVPVWQKIWYRLHRHEVSAYQSSEEENSAPLELQGWHLQPSALTLILHLLMSEIGS